ncbi:MAG: GMC family oxidoreductase N-terminal domain-containing protein [Gammaproteobacteria bacterium]|nr:GMC family oxidoreductase N-terminal domain-containing protein [Gammaproteobacteria bacterium]
MSADDNYDYLIVGGGTAGCVLANRLSAKPDVRVAMLEAGGKDDYFWIDIPVGYLFTIGNPRTDWCYKTAAEPGLNGRSIGYARGKVLGGCSSINAMIYMRGQAADYDHWAAMGNPGWSWQDVLPVFKRSENYQHGADEFHGAAGELRVEERRVDWDILDAWRDAAAQYGIPAIAEFNRGDNSGTAYFQMNQRRGRRWSVTRAFLDPVRARPNLTVFTNAHVQKIHINIGDNGRRATGVTFRDSKGGPPRTLAARRGVVLTAGAIGSPQLLQVSGIGNTDDLATIGVQPVHHLPGVGGNLHDHLQIRMVWQLSNALTMNDLARTLGGRMKMALQYFLFRRGPMTMPPSQLGAFARSDTGLAHADLEWHVQPLSLDRFGEPLHPYSAITPAVCDLRPTSRGHVRITTPDSQVAPEIRLNYLTTERDRAVAAKGMRMTRDIMAQPALAPFAPSELRPGPAVASDEALAAAAGDLGTTIFHPVGTCRMGPATDDGAVVDHRLRVHGIDGLYVADASIMPRITSGNTHAPTVMIAEKAAAMIDEAN